MKRISVIGAGFSGLSAACYLAQAGYSVEVFEKNAQIGGRARQLKRDGFTFDMGPTFYWMPDVFEKFFSDFNKKPSDYYELIRLDPGYRLYTERNDYIDIRAELDKICRDFEKEEPGSSSFLRRFLQEAEFNYRTAMEKVIYKPGRSVFELITPETLSRLGQFTISISKRIRGHIRSERLRHILEFPVIFLGAKPGRTPAFYSLMNYADMILGTWHIKGGIHEVVRGLQQLSEEMGVTVHTGAPVTGIKTKENKIEGITVNETFIPADFVVSSADYHHTESLLDRAYRNYTGRYWRTRTFAPSALLFYVGFNKKLKNIAHHTLFFDTDFESHASKIYDSPGWPDKPLFYANFPSITDRSLAPEGKEAAIFLIPLAPGLRDEPALREKYFQQIIERIEYLTDQQLKKDIIFFETYGITDFIRDYNAYKGNAYGLANTLRQTGFLRPAMENKKIINLLYTGQLTLPGPGVPPALISGKIAAGLINSKLN